MDSKSNLLFKHRHRRPSMMFQKKLCVVVCLSNTYPFAIFHLSNMTLEISNDIEFEVAVARHNTIKK